MQILKLIETPGLLSNARVIPTFGAFFETVPMYLPDMKRMSQTEINVCFRRRANSDRKPA